jgi:hypothetical protein
MHPPLAATEVTRGCRYASCWQAGLHDRRKVRLDVGDDEVRLWLRKAANPHLPSSLSTRIFSMVSCDKLATRWRTIWFDGSTDARYQPLLTR